MSASPPPPPPPPPFPGPPVVQRPPPAPVLISPPVAPSAPQLGAAAIPPPSPAPPFPIPPLAVYAATPAPSSVVTAPTLAAALVIGSLVSLAICGCLFVMLRSARRAQPAQPLKSAAIPATSVGYVDGASKADKAPAAALGADDLEGGEALSRRSITRSVVPLREESVRSEMLSVDALEPESQLAAPVQPPARRKRESRRLPRAEELPAPEQQPAGPGSFWDAVVGMHGAVTAALLSGAPKPPPVQVERRERRTHSRHITPAA